MAGKVQHQGAHLFVLEQLADDLLRGLFGVFGQGAPEFRHFGLGRHHRRRIEGYIGLRSEDVFHHLVEAAVHVAVTVGVLLGELPERGACLLDVAVDAHGTAIGQGHGDLQVGEDVLDVVPLLELEIRIHRGVVDH